MRRGGITVDAVEFIKRLFWHCDNTHCYKCGFCEDGCCQRWNIIEKDPERAVRIVKSMDGER